MEGPLFLGTLPVLNDYSRHLLIDAYNVIHHWPELRRALRRGNGVAREELAAAVRVLHDRERIRVTLVFDGRGSEIEVERPGHSLTFSYLYSPGSLSADDVIERLVGSASDPGNCIVVTRDLAERRTIEALGAVARSPEELRSWIARARAAVARQLADRSRRVDADWRQQAEAD